PAAASASPTPARRTWYFSPSAPRAFARTPTFPSTEPRLAGRPRRAYACLASALANTQNPLRDDDHEMDDLAVRRRRTGLWPRRGGRRQLPHRPGPLPGGGGGLQRLPHPGLCRVQRQCAGGGPAAWQRHRLLGALGVSYAGNLRLAAAMMSPEQWRARAKGGGLPPMPWPSLRAMTDAVHAYLLHLGPAG